MRSNYTPKEWCFAECQCHPTVTFFENPSASDAKVHQKNMSRCMLIAPVVDSDDLIGSKARHQVTEAESNGNELQPTL